MKYLLILTIVFYVLTGWSYHWAKDEGDNFGAAVLPLGLAGISSVLAIVYIVAALWLHRFW